MATASLIEDILARLERWLREHQPEFLAAMGPGVGQAALDALEQTVGRPLPEDFRAFYRWRDGIEYGRCEWGREGSVGDRMPFDWRPVTFTEVRNQYQVFRGMAAGTWTGPEWPATWWHPGWVPFLTNDNGEYTCVDAAGVWTGQRGQLVSFWNHHEAREIRAPSVGTWLAALLQDLEDGRVFDADGRRRDRVAHRYPPGYPLYATANDRALIPGPEPLGVGDRVRATDLAGLFAGIEGEVLRLVQGTWQVDVSSTAFGDTSPVVLQAGELALVERADRVGLAAEWDAANDPAHMFDLLGFPVSPRKWRLLGIACGRVHLDRLPAFAGPIADLLERSADDELYAPELDDLFRTYQDAARAGGRRPTWVDLFEPLRRTAATFGSGFNELRGVAAYHPDPPRVIRDIFPNPFRPPAIDLSWRTEAVVGLARRVYASRDFAPMPVLADALEDAGCADPDILAHCRGPGPHARGCWVVDLVLGKG